MSTVSPSTVGYEPVLHTRSPSLISNITGESEEEKLSRIHQLYRDSGTLLTTVSFIFHNFIYVALGVIVFLVGINIINKIFSPCFYHVYKYLLGYPSTLDRMKELLEDDYDHLWDNPNFCVAFLKLHEEYQELLSVANTDRKGKAIAASSFRKYHKLRLSQ